MRLLLIAVAALFLVGCSAKIVPGKVHEKTIKATAEMSPEPQAPAPVSTVELKKQTTTSVQKQSQERNLTEERTPAEEEVTQKEKKPRFPRSKLLTSSPYKVTMKTKKFSFSDTGFMNIYDNLINLQVFSMGKAVLDMRVSLKDDEICTGKLCNTKHGFNQTFLTGAYPDTLIENVLQRKPIMGGKNLK
ncbi:MAG: hypothetical protein DSZ05_03410, partial [Sulfurospirillum sp.]